MNKSAKESFSLALVFLIGILALFIIPNAARAAQGVQQLLYTVPNNTFIENPSGDSGVVTINDTSGSISTLQTSINNARSANPHSIIVIHLKRGATYSVSTAGLTLGSQECLVGSGALVQAANSSVTVPLVQINSGSTNVSIAGGTFDGNGAGINAIYAPAAARVNVDKVVAKNCGQDCILLKGQGNTTYDNEMTVTRSDCSGSAAHAGISIQNCTQAALTDNNCHDNSAGIYLSCAWADVANNTCENNTTGIDVAGGDDNVVANNTCDNNGTGIHVAGSKHMIVSNVTGGNSTAGIATAGTSDTFIDNFFGSGNAVNFSSGGTTENIVAYEAPITASGQNYFYPPLIDNQHTATTIVNGMGRTDLTIGSTTIASVQSQYNTALANNPNNVIVLHLNGTFTVGSSPLTLQSDTCILLNGTIVINSSTTASAAISCSKMNQISISGGTIDAGNNTGITGISILDGAMIQIDGMTIKNFGSKATSIPGSDAIHFSEFGSSSGTPLIVTRSYINGSASRAIWSQVPTVKGFYSDNTCIGTRAGIDCDSATVGAVCMFNTILTNDYSLWYEQGAQHNTSIGNVCNYNQHGLDVGNNADTKGTAYNSYICNVAQGTGIVVAAVGANTWTSHNFLFDNVILNASIAGNEVGTNNYFSQNYLSSSSLTSTAADTWFNSPDVDGNLQIRDSNSGLAVVVQGASTAGGAPVVTATPVAQGNGTGDDEWQFIPTSYGFYQIVNKNSGLAMVVSGASTSNGAPIIQYAYSSGATYNDEWLIQPVGNGLYNFVNRLSGLYLDVAGASLTPGTPLDQWSSNGGANQQFSLVEDAVSTIAPDFSISASPSSRTVAAASGTTYTVTITATNGFNSSVNLSIGGLPTGATGVFNPTSVTGSGTSTLSVSTSSSTPAGSYTLTITGTSGNLVHSTTVTLIVEDFTISATPASQTVTAGNSTNYTVNVGSINGFGDTVSFSVSGLPTGAGANFNPTSVNGAGSSTMTITTLTSTPVSTNTIAVKGTSGSLSHTANVTLIVKAASGGSLPSGWTDTDIGVVGVVGSASYNSGTFTVSGSGADIWNAGDQFNYAYQSVSGDQTIVARVASENGTASYAKAGVMIRETLATNSVEASVLLTPTNGVAMEIRPTTGAASINVTGWITGPKPPQWVKLVRSGSTFTGYYSANGSTWTQFAATNVTMSSSATAGLVVTSHDNTSLNTATFDNVSITGVSFVGIYKLQNVASSLVLNNQGFLTNGSAITQWTATTTSSNLDWQFFITTNGYYQINSCKSGLDAVVQSASTSTGAGIIQWSFGATGNDQWKPVANSDGSYTFYNLHSGLVLGDPGSSTSTSTQMDQETANGGANQKWTLLKQ